MRAYGDNRPRPDRNNVIPPDERDYFHIYEDLGKYQDIISDMKLIDYKVRITAGGTEAVTRVLIDSEDSEGRRWSTIGVSPNIVDASFQALLDAMNWKILKSLEG